MAEEKQLEEIQVEELYAPELREKGVVKEILKPEKVETRFGVSYRIPIVVQLGKDKETVVSVLVREKTLQRGIVHPRSNLYKLLKKYGCKKLKDLIGKEVELYIDSRGFYRISLEG